MLLGRFRVPSHGPGDVAVGAPRKIEGVGQFQLGVGMVLLGRFLPPFDRGLEVFLHTVPIVICGGEVVHGVDVACLRRLGEPFRRFGAILFNAFPVVVEQAEGGLRVRIALPGGKEAPGGGLYGIDVGAASVAVDVVHRILGFCVPCFGLDVSVPDHFWDHELVQFHRFRRFVSHRYDRNRPLDNIFVADMFVFRFVEEHGRSFMNAIQGQRSVFQSP